MKFDATTNMEEYTLLHHCFIIDVIVSDYEIIMRAALKHSSIVDWGQGIK